MPEEERVKEKAEKKRLWKKRQKDQKRREYLEKDGRESNTNVCRQIPRAPSARRWDWKSRQLKLIPTLAIHLPFRPRPLQMAMGDPRPALGTQLRDSVVISRTAGSCLTIEPGAGNILKRQRCVLETLRGGSQPDAVWELTFLPPASHPGKGIRPALMLRGQQRELAEIAITSGAAFCLRQQYQRRGISGLPPSTEFLHPFFHVELGPLSLFCSCPGSTAPRASGLLSPPLHHPQPEPVWSFPQTQSRRPGPLHLQDSSEGWGILELGPQHLPHTR